MCKQKHDKLENGSTKINDAKKRKRLSLEPEVVGFILPSESQSMEHEWKNPGSFISVFQDKIH